MQLSESDQSREIAAQMHRPLIVRTRHVCQSVVDAAYSPVEDVQRTCDALQAQHVVPIGRDVNLEQHLGGKTLLSCAYTPSLRPRADIVNGVASIEQGVGRKHLLASIRRALGSCLPLQLLALHLLLCRLRHSSDAGSSAYAKLPSSAC